MKNQEIIDLLTAEDNGHIIQIYNRTERIWEDLKNPRVFSEYERYRIKLVEPSCKMGDRFTAVDQLGNIYSVVLCQVAPSKLMLINFLEGNRLNDLRCDYRENELDPFDIPISVLEAFFKCKLTLLPKESQESPKAT